MVRLLNIYQDNMVVQRNNPFTIVGHKDNDDKLNDIYLDDGENKILPQVVNDQGCRFEIVFAPIKGSYKAYQLVVEECRINNIYFGDVILTLGQSNMAYAFSALEDYEKVIPLIDNNDIYIYDILEENVLPDGNVTRPFFPREDINPKFKWQKLNKDNVISMSGLSILLGAYLRKKVDCPIGIVHTSMGGLAIESYIARDVLLNDKSIVKSLKGIGAFIEKESDYNTYSFRNYTQMSGVYNEKIAPLKPFRFKAAVFYLGESACFDETRARYFRRALTLLIKSYREYFSTPSLPFVISEIQDCYYPYVDGKGYNLINEAISELKLKNVDFVINYDIESRWLNINNKDIYYHPIHPINKDMTARRIIEVIYKKYYLNEKCYFPHVDSFERNNDKLLIKIVSIYPFKKGKEFVGFTIAGNDNIYYSARAVVVAPYLIELSSSYVKEPINFTYAFTQYNYICNAKNIKNEPLVPYRSHRDKIKDSLYLEDQILLSCDYLYLKKEDNFGYEVSGGFPHPLIEQGELFNNKVLLSLDNKDKTEGLNSLKVRCHPNKKDGYYYFSIRFNFGLSGLKHKLAFFKYLQLDIKGDNYVEFHGALYRANGFIYKLPLVDKNNVIAPFINIDNHYRKYAISLEKKLDGSECQFDLSSKEKEQIVGLEIYFRSLEKCELNVDNLVLTNNLDLVRDYYKKEVDNTVDTSLFIPKNS